MHLDLGPVALERAQIHVLTLSWFVNELTMRKGSEDRVGTS